MDTPHNVRLQRERNQLDLATPGHESYLAYIRRIVADLAQQVGFAEEEVAKIEMAVDEACSNVVEHAYAKDTAWSWKQRDPEIRMQIRVSDNDLIIEINDHGQRFDFSSYRPTSIEETIQQMQRGGYGISIMRRFMDEVQYSSNDVTGNTLRLVKHLKKR
jgi:serine/threonine-protein kinase RsbW